MKDLCQYGNRPEDEWEILPWIPDPRPPFKIWVKLEQIAPFFLIPHHPYAISLLLKISDGFRAEEFCRLGLTGSSGDWERLVRRSIDIFMDGHTRNIPDLYDGAIEITPIPTVEELNAHVWGEEFHACIIEKAEFEAIWENRTYNGEIKGQCCRGGT